MTTINGICLESIKVSGYDIWKLNASEGPWLSAQYGSLTYAAKNYTWIAQDFESILRIEQSEGLKGQLENRNGQSEKRLEAPKDRPERQSEDPQGQLENRNGQSEKRLEAPKDRPERQSGDPQGQSSGLSEDYVDLEMEIRKLERRIEDMERRLEDRKTCLQGMEERPTDLQRQLRQLLKYYYLGMREAINTLAPTEKSALQESISQEEKRGVCGILKDRLYLIDQVDEFGETLVMIEELLPANLSIIEPRAFQIPNISLLELLIHVKYSSVDAKPTTLQKFKEMLQDLSFYEKHQRLHRSNDKDSVYRTGLPAVLFVCIGRHGLDREQRYVLGSCNVGWQVTGEGQESDDKDEGSKHDKKGQRRRQGGRDAHNRLESKGKDKDEGDHQGEHDPVFPIHREAKKWRRARFIDVSRSKRMELYGNKVRNAFTEIVGEALDAVKPDRVSVKAEELAEARELANNIKRNKLTPTQYNAIARKVHQRLRRSMNMDYPTRCGFNHRGEFGRPFHGHGPEIFTEMSRCWKCRFLYFYDVNAASLEREHPQQTGFSANRGLECAEDLVHHQCQQLVWSAQSREEVAESVWLPFPTDVPIEL